MISAIKQKNRPGNLFRTIFLRNEGQMKDILKLLRKLSAEEKAAFFAFR